MSDWSSDVCASDLLSGQGRRGLSQFLSNDAAIPAAIMCSYLPAPKAEGHEQKANCDTRCAMDSAGAEEEGRYHQGTAYRHQALTSWARHLSSSQRNDRECKDSDQLIGSSHVTINP